MKIHLSPYLAGALFLLFIVLINGFAYLFLRSMRGMNFGWFRYLKRDATSSFREENENWDELHRRVEDLSKK